MLDYLNCMRVFLSGIVFLMSFVTLKAQTTNCLEIQSILVDACVPGTGCATVAAPACNCEGKNEMVFFITGPNPITVASLNITWPNNPFQGMCQDATTAGLVAGMNATITSCGYLLEPPGGVIPANKKVLLVTSTDMCPGANSFAGLTDTLYVIFQCAGNYQGHFANYGTGLRTLTMGIGACSQSVTYDRAQLLTQAGVPGAQDGGAVRFAPDGTPTYFNDGCVIPVPVLTLNAGTNFSVCSGLPIQLNGTVNGLPSFVHWNGGNGGSFTQASSDTTVYQPVAADVGTLNFILSVRGACPDTLRDTVQVQILQPVPQTLTPSGAQTLCENDTLTLTVNGGGSNHTWTGGFSGTTLQVTQGGTYTVQSSDACASYSDTVTVTLLPSANAGISASGPLAFCQGGSVTLTASPPGGVWSNNNPGLTFTTNQSGSFYYVATNSCGPDTAFAVVQVQNLPQASINASGPTDLCTGQTVVLTGSPSGGTWQPSGGANPLTAGTAGNYIYVVTNACGTAADSVQVTVNQLPQLTLTPSGTLTPCKGDTIQLIVSSNGTPIWNVPFSGDTLTVTESGYYSVQVSNACGTDSASADVQFTGPDVSFTASPEMGTAPLTVQFTNTSGSTGVFYWNFGNGNYSNEANPGSTIYLQAAAYNPVLYLTDANGCLDSASVTIIVEDTLTITIPNVFTPGGDGINETFLIQTKGAKTFHAYVYNRWGNLIYHWTDPTQGWNGKTGLGTDASGGVYMLILQAESFNGKSYEFRETFTLVR